jgi:hypothetical protein
MAARADAIRLGERAVALLQIHAEARALGLRSITSALDVTDELAAVAVALHADEGVPLAHVEHEDVARPGEARRGPPSGRGDLALEDLTEDEVVARLEPVGSGADGCDGE